jgi:hypothetical protein
VADCPRTPVTLDELTNWKENPDPLLGNFFVAPSENVGEDDEFFRVMAFSAVFEGEKLFYLQYADEDEAYAFRVDHFFELLEKAARVLVGSH